MFKEYDKGSYTCVIPGEKGGQKGGQGGGGAGGVIPVENGMKKTIHLGIFLYGTKGMSNYS